MLYLNISSTNYQNDVIWRSIKSNLKVINKSGIPIQFNQAVKASFEFCNREIFIVKEKKEDIDKVYGIFVSNKNFNIISNKGIFEAYGDGGKIAIVNSGDIIVQHTDYEKKQKRFITLVQSGFNVLE